MSGTATFSAIEEMDMMRPMALRIPLSVYTSTIASGFSGRPFSQSLTAVGGTLPYTWSLLTGALPAGLTLSPAGVISGTPTAAGAFGFTVQVQDSTGATASASYNMTVVAPPLFTTAATLPNGEVTVAYNQVIAAAGGARPYTWSSTGSTLPAGLTFNTATWAVTGTPTSAGTGSVTVGLHGRQRTLLHWHLHRHGRAGAGDYHGQLAKRSSRRGLQPALGVDGRHIAMHLVDLVWRITQRADHERHDRRHHGHAHGGGHRHIQRLGDRQSGSGCRQEPEHYGDRASTSVDHHGDSAQRRDQRGV